MTLELTREKCFMNQRQQEGILDGREEQCNQEYESREAGLLQGMCLEQGEGIVGRMWKIQRSEKAWFMKQNKTKNIQSRDTVQGAPKRNDQGHAAAGSTEEKRMTQGNLKRKDSVWH